MSPADRRTERRRHLRIPLRVEIRIGEAWEGPEWAINISVGGLGIQSRAPLKVGQRVRLRFRLAPGAPLLETDADVVWCVPEIQLIPGLHYYELGASFVNLDEADREMIRRFVESKEYQPEGERERG